MVAVFTRDWLGEADITRTALVHLIRTCVCVCVYQCMRVCVCVCACVDVCVVVGGYKLHLPLRLIRTEVSSTVIRHIVCPCVPACGIVY